MAERASVFQVVQLGIEATPGTNVSANKKLQSISIDPAVKADVKTFRPKGTKFATVSAVGKDYVEAKIGGQATYSEVTYLLASAMKKVTSGTQIIPTTGLAYRWVFAPANGAGDDAATFTVEQGSAERAHKFNYGIVSAMGLKWSRDAVEVSGSMIGQKLQDGITLTTSPTEIELTPVLGSQVSVYLADTWAGLDGASALTRCINGDWNIADRWAPIWALDSSKDGFSAHVEREPKLSLKLLLEADAAGMGLLSTLRSGATKFARIKAQGGLIETGNNYLLQIDMAAKVKNVSEFKDQEGIFAVEFEFEGAYDSVSGKAVEVTVVNKVASL